MVATPGRRSVRATYPVLFIFDGQCGSAPSSCGYLGTSTCYRGYSTAATVAAAYGWSLTRSLGSPRAPALVWKIAGRQLGQYRSTENVTEVPKPSTWSYPVPLAPGFRTPCTNSHSSGICRTSLTVGALLTAANCPAIKLTALSIRVNASQITNNFKSRRGLYAGAYEKYRAYRQAMGKPRALATTPPTARPSQGRRAQDP
jgi:hypothetical protein